VSFCGWLRRGMSCHVMSFDVVVTSFDAMLWNRFGLKGLISTYKSFALNLTWTGF